MNKLEELIQKLCPNGVEYKPLNNVVKSISTGLNPRKNFTLNIEGATNFYVTVKEITTGKIVFSDKTDKITDEALNIIQDRSNLESGDILLSGIGTIGKVALVDIPLGNWNCSESVFLIKPKNDVITSAFLAYILGSKNVQKFFQEKARGSTLKGIRQQDLKLLKVPVPPIEVQEEIVRILDKFTELSAELTAELTARKKQYNYFCDKLLTQSNHISYKKVKDLAKFTYGFTDKAKDAGNVRYIRITDIDETGCLKHDDKKFLNISENNHSYLLKKGDLVMARTGATFGKTLYFEDNEPSIYASFLIKIELDNNKILNRFYWHFSKSSLYWEQANNLVSTGGQPQFNTGAIGQVVVPVPPLEEQERIVAILDRFDKICNDISEGLPAEIEARQKQYEYYRDKLLTFEEIAQ